MRLLVIEDEARFAERFRGTLACHWPDFDLVGYAAQRRGAPAPEFLATGFDAVLLDRDCAGGRGLAWLCELAERPGFAPLVYLTTGSDAVAARSLGACAVVDPGSVGVDELVATLNAAAGRQARARAERLASGATAAEEDFGGVHLPGYRRIRHLAARAATDLYLAESVSVGALVVVKVTRDRQAHNDLDAPFRRFLQEYELVERIAHPNIVRVYDIGVTEEHAYLVMEYFRGGDLRKRMREALTPREALRYALEISRMLEAMHRAGVLHRDLKPDNVMLRDDGSLALIDFGLAKQEALDLHITDQGTIFGTPHYMSPEQGHGEPVDGRSDLYSLGVILFEMLTRAKPYNADNPMAIIYKHRKEPIPALTGDLAALQPLIGRLLAKRPAERFATADEASAALEEAVQRLDAHGEGA